MPEVVDSITGKVVKGAMETVTVRRHAGDQCVQLGFMRSGDSRVPPTVRLQVQDEDMALLVLLDMDPKQFADVISGMATWVPNGLGPAPLDRESLITFATWLSEQAELDVATPDEAVDLFIAGRS